MLRCSACCKNDWNTEQLDIGIEKFTEIQIKFTRNREMGCSAHIPLGGGPGHNPGHTGETHGWLGNILELPQKS